MDTLGGEDVSLQRLDQRHQRRRRRPHPVSQGRDVEVDTLASIGRALAGQRQMQPVLAEQDVGQQVGAGPAAGNRMRRRGRLRDRLAGPARVLLPYMLDHLPLAWHQLQHLGHVLTQLVQHAATTRAGLRNGIDDPLARQVLGQRPARWLAPLERPHCRALRHDDLQLGRVLGQSLFQLEQLQLELAQQRATLRRLAISIVLKPGDRLLELLDAQRLVAQRNTVRLALGQ
jgi:hypothetical protein